MIGEAGQTVAEYALLIGMTAVLIAVAVTILPMFADAFRAEAAPLDDAPPIVQGWLPSVPDYSCPCTPNPDYDGSAT